MTSVLLDALVPIFAVMALGYFPGWVRDIDNQHVAELKCRSDGFRAAGLSCSSQPLRRHGSW